MANLRTEESPLARDHLSDLDFLSQRRMIMGALTFDVGLAAKLKQAVARNGITDLADIDWLCEGDNIASVRRLRQGHVQLVVNEHVIDCDADPFVPDG